jgi:hypothetical protein
MDFGPLQNGDVLDQYDFDSFLNTDDNASGPFVFDTGIYLQDRVEAGIGERIPLELMVASPIKANPKSICIDLFFPFFRCYDSHKHILPEFVCWFTG